jgi:hypothetical protein
MITEIIINYPKTWIAENLSQGEIPALCSKVPDLFRPRSPVVAWSATLEPHSATPAEMAVARREAMPALAPSSCRGTLQESAFFVCDSQDRPTLSHAANHQVFVRTLLEDCRFFAHLVLRCVRASSRSQESAAPRLNLGSTSLLSSPASPSCDLPGKRPQRHAPRIETDAGAPTLQRLWVAVACRHVPIRAFQEKHHE